MLAPNLQGTGFGRNDDRPGCYVRVCTPKSAKATDGWLAHGVVKATSCQMLAEGQCLQQRDAWRAAEPRKKRARQAGTHAGQIHQGECVQWHFESAFALKAPVLVDQDSTPGKQMQMLQGFPKDWGRLIVGKDGF